MQYVLENIEVPEIPKYPHLRHATLRGRKGLAKDTNSEYLLPLQYLIYLEAGKRAITQSLVVDN